MTGNPMLHMRGIRKSFGGIEVLHGVDLEIGAGEIHGLIGHNGAGKSTLMRVLGGVYPDYTGTVDLDGTRVDLASPKESLAHGVAVVYQDFSLIPDLDVAHNIALGREPTRLGGRFIDHGALVRRSAAEAERFGMRLPMRTPVRSLGVAAQQQTEIVRALARDARILVMDEPTARLAPAEREQLFVTMRSLAAQGMSIIYISHFLDEVAEVTDNITVLRDGRVTRRLPSADTTADSLARLLVGEEEAEVRRRHAGVRTPGPEMLTISDLAVRGRPPVSLSVRSGEIVALAGLVGSGRTRLARAIVGDVAAAGGVRLAGRDLRRRSPMTSARSGLLMIPEDRKVNGLVLTGTVTQNIEMTALSTHLSTAGFVRRGERRKLVAGTIRQFDVRPPDPNRPVANLSGGNAQKVLLGRAVAADPKLLILDQPTAGVDIGAKAELHARVFELAESGAGVLVISDDLDETLELADRVLVFVNGRITADRPAAELDRATLLAAMSSTKEN
ncbi:sugar ABC transporter ATP-binding protein [Kineosporia succinea]|uniref:ABC-type sugar transport system ATPase subunit n=2 Tax=Kineosporia succinea TaxID=84632 RepID=A0ABT9PC04_9ACTN|nr:ABC-type sugar transport system ATPase subunit [Kineosporia succinea]